MDDRITLSYIAMVAAAMLMGLLLLYAILYRHERGVRLFVWVLVCRVVYAGCAILEIRAATLADKLFYRSIEQTSLVFMVPLMILFVLDLYGQDLWLKLRRAAALLGLFAVWPILIWTDSRWHLIFSNTALVDGQLILTRTPYAIAFNILCYAILAGCVFFLIRYIRSARPEIRRAGMWMLLFGCIPAVVELLKLALPSLTTWLLPLSVYSGICGMLMFWLAIRLKLFSIVPLARNVIVDTMQEGMLIVNERGDIVDSNEQVRWLVGSDVSRPILGRNVMDVLAAWPKWAAAYDRAEASQVEINCKMQEENRSYIVNIYPFFTQRGRKQGMVSIIVDITEKQRALEQIARLNQMKDQLFTAVSHDIRDPLAAQVNLVEILEADKPSLPPESTAIIDALSEQIRNTHATVENLLEWFRGQKDGITLHPEPIRLSDVVQEASRLLIIRCEAKQIDLYMDIEADLKVNADREALILIVRNLLSNAVKFSNRGGRVNVSAKAKGSSVELSVQDFGVGMSEEQIRQVFDDTRFDSSVGTEGEKGTGLGLLVNRQFLRMSGGTMKVRSEPGVGSTFTIEFENGGIR